MAFLWSSPEPHGRKPEVRMKNIKKHLRKYVTFQPRQWLLSTRRIEVMVDEWLALPAGPRLYKVSGEPFAVLITPWLGTAVPWYSIVVGLLLAGRGSEVVFIFDDLPFGAHPYRSAFIRACIRVVLRKVRARYVILVLSDFKSAKTESDRQDEAMIGRLASLNAVHALRGEILSDGRAEYIAHVREQLWVADAAIQKLLSYQGCEAILIPGGIYGTTGLWLDRARRSGARVASYDAGGFGTVLLAADGIAAQLQDVPRAFRWIKAEVSSPSEDAFVLECARVELEKRRQGKDTFVSQKAATSAGPLDTYRGAILLALNSSWDQAALGLHTVFGTNTNWILETVQWVVNHTDATIVVRQHPSERLEFASTTDDYGRLLQSHFGDQKRVLFIAADDAINTYELLTVVSTVIAYTSTVGVEAAALGKRVITPSSNYYSGLGFVWGAASRSEYFELINRSLSGELQLTSEMRNDAAYCYYVAQICNWIFSPFSPESYPLWSKESITSLSANSTVRVLISALQENVPAALINHRNSIAAKTTLTDA